MDRAMLGSRFALAVVLAVQLASCYPVTRLQTPTVLEPGKFDLVLGASAGTPGPTANANAHFTPELAARLGIVPDVDVGLRLRITAAELSGKYQITRGASEMAISVAGIVAEDSDVMFDEDPTPSSRTKAAAGRVALYAGTDSRRSVSCWISPALDVGVRQFEYGLQDRRSEEPFVAPGLLGGVVVGSASAPVRLLIEAGAMLPVAGAGVLSFERHTYRLRLGPGDPRAELTIGLAF